MVTRQVYSTGKDKSTWDGGYSYVIARVEREHLDGAMVTDWWVDCVT